MFSPFNIVLPYFLFYIAIKNKWPTYSIPVRGHAKHRNKTTTFLQHYHVKILFVFPDKMCWDESSILEINNWDIDMFLRITSLGFIQLAIVQVAQIMLLISLLVRLHKLDNNTRLILFKWEGMQHSLPAHILLV
jgi:hypothetical protein